jgi:hypothetical protein
MRMPASVAPSDPPATAPRNPREAKRDGNGRRICPHPVAIAKVKSTASLHFMDVFIVGDWVRQPACYTSAVEPTDPAPPAVTKSPSENEPMLYCPVCSVRLEQRKCKLFCPQCGYYMSCADYY